MFEMNYFIFTSSLLEKYNAVSACVLDLLQLWFYKETGLLFCGCLYPSWGLNLLGDALVFWGSIFFPLLPPFLFLFLLSFSLLCLCTVLAAIQDSEITIPGWFFMPVFLMRWECVFFTWNFVCDGKLLLSFSCYDYALRGLFRLAEYCTKLIVPWGRCHWEVFSFPSVASPAHALKAES